MESEDKLPKTVRDAWYESVDRARVSELDEVLMQNVYVFFEKAIEK